MKIASVKFVLRAFAALAAAAGTLAPARAQNTAWSYRGFAVRERGGKLDDALQHAVADQIDIVLAVGLNADAIAFFHSVPLNVVPAARMPRGSPGRYLPAYSSVWLTAHMAAVGHKPVLLHELMHAYHDRKLARGFRNPEVRELYEAARRERLFPPGSHMMQNPSEYFACAATTYLFGVTAQEPFQRGHLERQPDLRHFLQTTFGPACGHYQGRITMTRPGPDRSRGLAAFLARIGPADRAWLPAAG